MIRTVQWRSVYEGILRRDAIDPQTPVTSVTARNAVEHANERVRTAWRFWEWPELTLTEERAFRTIWNSTRQFSKVGTNGKPDELFYIPTFSYYVVNGSAITDPPVGTLPTNVAYFTPLTLLDRFIALDQVCRKPIGEALAIWNSNPRLNRCAQELPFRQSEKGIDVLGYCGNSVFLKYRIRPDQFTIVPFISSKNYVVGNVVYFAGTGECYRAVANSFAQQPPNAAYWRQALFPEIFAHYVKAAAYADGLSESAPKENDPVKLQIRNTKVAMALQEANEALQDEVDILLRQGNGFRYHFRKRNWWCQDIGPSSTVTTLTDVCDDDSGFVTPQPQGSAGLFYFPDVLSLKTTAPTLIGKSSILFSVGAMAVISTGQHFRLDAGAADSSDPGQGQPGDYNATTHNVHWTQAD